MVTVTVTVIIQLRYRNGHWNHVKGAALKLEICKLNYSSFDES
jgi:hypothetical protein